MRTAAWPVWAAAVLLGSVWAPSQQRPEGRAYAELVELFRDWREFQRPPLREGIPDYTAAAMEAQRRRLPELQARLQKLDASAFSVAQRVDLELVRAEMNGLDFDHRVLRPWSRDPSFYRVVYEAQSDTPLHEGPAFAGAIELWQHAFPLKAEELAPFRARLQGIPRVLAQARGNLVEDARDLWRLGIREQRSQAFALARLAKRLAPLHPDLVADVERAKGAVDEFRVWLESELPKKTGPSGVGVQNYDWYQRQVHLVPLTWEQELTLMQRELARSLAHLKLEEHRNRSLPPREPAASPEEWQRRAGEAIGEYVAFLKHVVTPTDYMEPALRAQVGPYLAPGDRHFFAEVEMREPLLMRCHHFHWIDLARMQRAPHPSPIRRVPSLYNIWDTRAEGFATAMEEMMTSAGLLDGKPRGRELMYVMLAQRAARAISSLRMHSNEWGVDEAVRFASAQTPRGWLAPDSELVWGEQQLYLEQPGYGTSYLTGKALIESLLAERAEALGAGFELRRFSDEFLAVGMVPVSLARYELLGRDDEISRLRR